MSKPLKSNVALLETGVELLDGAVDPTAGGGVVAPLGSLYIRTVGPELWQKTGAAATAWTQLSGTLGSGNGSFGAGVDGDAVIAAGTTTLTRDMFYNNLTVQNGGILRPSSFKVFVRDTLTIDLGGTISSTGNNAINNGGGTATGVGGTLFIGNAGGGGGFPNGNAGGASSNYPFGLTPGRSGGGAGSDGSLGLGGAGGIVTPRPAADGVTQAVPFFLWQILPNAALMNQLMGGGAGGGQGGRGDSQQGGGGGGGAGPLFISAKTIVNNGAIEANGGNGSTFGVNGGGGGGGGGGVIWIITKSFTGNAPVANGGSPALTATAGEPGNIVMMPV